MQHGGGALTRILPPGHILPPGQFAAMRAANFQLILDTIFAQSHTMGRDGHEEVKYSIKQPQSQYSYIL